jgi:hypothetical protein
MNGGNRIRKPYIKCRLPYFSTFGKKGDFIFVLNRIIWYCMVIIKCTAFFSLTDPVFHTCNEPKTIKIYPDWVNLTEKKYLDGGRVL